MQALHTAATGMFAQEMNVEVISNNVANMRTTGFKRQYIQFQDLLYQQFTRPGTTSSDQGNTVPAGVYIGFEDLYGGGDMDYNDNQFLFTNVGTPTPTGVTPEPSSFLLLGTGILGAAGAVRRKLATRL